MESDHENIKKFRPNSKKKSKKTKIFLLVFILILIGVGTYLLFSLSTFNIEQIEVFGNSYYSEEEIVEASHIMLGENIFGQVVFVGKAGVNSLPYVDSTKFKIKFPNKLIIKINERTSSYYALDKEKNLYYRLSSNGEILEQAENKNEEEITVTGISFDDKINFGTRINDIYIEKLNIYEKIKKEYEASQIGGIITKVGFENSLTTIVLNDKLSVIFPNLTNLKYNMAVLKEIIKNIGEDSAGIIDLNKDNPTFSNF